MWPRGDHLPETRLPAEVCNMRGGDVLPPPPHFRQPSPSLLNQVPSPTGPGNFIWLWFRDGTGAPRGWEGIRKRKPPPPPPSLLPPARWNPQPHKPRHLPPFSLIWARGPPPTSSFDLGPWRHSGCFSALVPSCPYLATPSLR